MKIARAMLFDYLCASEGWLTNGHWAVRRSIVEGDIEARCRTERDLEKLGKKLDITARWMTDKQIASIGRGTGRSKPFVVSSWIVGESRLLLSVELDAVTLVNRRYLRALGLDKPGTRLWSRPGGYCAVLNAPTFANATILLMPMFEAFDGVTKGFWRRLGAVWARGDSPAKDKAA